MIPFLDISRLDIIFAKISKNFQEKLDEDLIKKKKGPFLFLVVPPLGGRPLNVLIRFTHLSHEQSIIMGLSLSD